MNRIKAPVALATGFIVSLAEVLNGLRSDETIEQLKAAGIPEDLLLNLAEVTYDVMVSWSSVKNGAA